MKIERRSAWLMAARATEAPVTARIFCFPHAGGGASAYTRWGRDAPDGVELCAVQLPGREGQIGEAPIDRLDTLLPVLDSQIRPFLDRPFVFFGHSMGALVAFELAAALERRGGPAPAHVVVSGRRAPHLPPVREPLHALPPGRFEAALLELDGTPADILADQELMALLEPTLRADLALCETYHYRSIAPLATRLSAWGGEDDPEASRDDLDAWRVHTGAFAGVRLFSGRHFYLRDHSTEIVRALAGTLPPTR